MKKLLGAVSLLSLLLVAQSADDVNARIRREAADHSQILRTLHMLTDRYGPRLTGSPNHEAAAKWAVQQMTEWGFKNAHLEPWDFGHPGWLNESASGHIVSPVRANLKFEVLGWTPSTNGPVTGSAIELAPPQGPLPTRPAPAAPTAATADGESGGRGRGGAPQRLGPTKEEMQQWLEANKDKVRGKIVMMGKAASIAVDFTPPAKRRSDVQTRQQFDPNNPNAGRGGGRGGNQNPGDPNRLTANQVTETTDAWLKANGALMRTVILRNEDYGRIERLLADGEDVRLKFDIVNRDYPAGKTSYNVVAEIPGSDKADEIVMLGGHLDSWHAATGATDNAIGSSIMMEAARIIQALGLKPRRTVRVALWSGEEQGLLGSQAYVKEHFGSAEEPKPEFAKLNCYFNIDSGTGRVRGASVFGPPTAAAIVRNALEPFADLGVVGAVATSSRAIGGTDSTSFNNAGLAGVGMTQDPIEYQSHTWHTMLDTYERIVPEDAKNAAIVIASAVWQVANRDEMLPRFTREQMPAKPRPSNR
jgi:carboxypeptidase Q